MNQLIVYAMLIMTAQANTTPAGKHLFVLSGQSNMARLDPTVSFTPAVCEALGETNVIVVKDAQGGQPIRRWYKQWKAPDGKAPESTGDLYERLMDKVRAAIEGQELASVTFVWMQGEKDAREQNGEVYADSLQGLLKQLEEDLGRDDINVVIGRLSDFDMQNASYGHWTKIREIQEAVADAHQRAVWVDTDDLNGKNNALHYTKEGYNIFGQRLAEAAIKLVHASEAE